MDAPEHASSKTAKPVYRFGGQLPAALVDLRDKPRWVAWDYVGKGNHWTEAADQPAHRSYSFCKRSQYMGNLRRSACRNEAVRSRRCWPRTLRSG